MADRFTPTRHTKIREVPITQRAEAGDMLVGYRYRFAFTGQGDIPDWTEVVRGAGGLTFVVKAMPVSGPIFLRSIWDEDKPDGVLWYAACVGCNGNSRMYKIRHSRIRLWAALHRCRKRVELDGIPEREVD